MKRIIKAFIRTEDGGYVVECPDVRGVTQGDTLDEAIANLREVIELALEDGTTEYGLAHSSRNQIPRDTGCTEPTEQS